MALVPLATKGNYFHVYYFRVKPGHGDEFIELFNKFDYGGNNPFHRSQAQVKDGVLCRDAADPDHFYLIGEWSDIDEHRRIRELVAREIRPEFVQLIEGGHFVPAYAEIVSMTPQEVLDRAQRPDGRQ
jgi:quinol monooxygenase YgiN